MQPQLSTLTKAGLYYAIALGLAVLVAVFAERLGERVTLITMFTPLAAILLMLLVVSRDGYTRSGWRGLGLHTAGFRSWGWALLGPPLALAGSYSLVWLLGIGRADMSGWYGPVDLLIGILIASAFAFAEEIGWRGYLLPHLLPLGRIRALFVSGLLHGIYHLPLMLMTPFYHGSGDRRIVVPLFLLTLTAAGLFYGFLRLKSESTWPAVIAHGTVNTFWAHFSSITVAVSSPLLLEYLAGESGLFTLIIVMLISGWLVYRMNRRLQPVHPSAPVSS